jgi:hypothetical protein
VDARHEAGHDEPHAIALRVDGICHDKRVALARILLMRPDAMLLDVAIAAIIRDLVFMGLRTGQGRHRAPQQHRQSAESPRRVYYNRIPRI